MRHVINQLHKHIRKMDLIGPLLPRAVAPTQATLAQDRIIAIVTASAQYLPDGAEEVPLHLCPYSPQYGDLASYGIRKRRRRIPHHMCSFLHTQRMPPRHHTHTQVVLL